MAKLRKIYPILPLRNTVLFPNQIIPIYIGREQSLKLISDVSKEEDKNIDNFIFEISKSNNVSEASIAATKNDIDY